MKTVSGRQAFGSRAALFVAVMAVGCAGAEGDEGEVVPAKAAPAASDGNVALRIERAARALDRGGEAREAQKELEAVLADPAATGVERDEATLELSRALDVLGDREGAIHALERLLAAHAGDREWASASDAERRLHKLLTGSEEPKVQPGSPSPSPVSPFARALVKYFPSDEQKRVRVTAFLFGPPPGHDRATFDVAGAVREAREEACPDCKDGQGIQSNTNSESSWLGIPRWRSALGTALVVHYFHLEGGQTPARYDADLPLPSAEISARLAQGQGLVAARERPGAPPVVLIAAPRKAQLDDVEKALAAMEALPLEPKRVELSASLESGEIKSVMRACFRQLRGCYEDVLKTDADAAGRVTLDFEVAPDGHVTRMSGHADGPAVAPMVGCVERIAQGLVFPTAAGKTTVTYPILFTPSK